MTDLLDSVLTVEQPDPATPLEAHREAWPFNSLNVDRSDTAKSLRVRLRRSIEAMQKRGWTVYGIEPRHCSGDPKLAMVAMRGWLSGSGYMYRGSDPWFEVTVREPLDLQDVQGVLLEHDVPAIVNLNRQLVIYQHFPTTEAELAFVEMRAEHPDRYANEGWDPVEFHQRLQSKESPHEAAIWMEAKVSPSASDAWKLHLHDHFRSTAEIASVAVRWAEAGFTPEQAAPWIKGADPYPANVMDWMAAGCTPAEFSAWAGANFALRSYAEARAWMDAGFSDPHQVLRWLHFANSRSRALELIRDGMTEELLTHYENANIRVAHYDAWKDSCGLGAVEARRWFLCGVCTQESREDWERIGLGLIEVESWVAALGLDTTPAQVKSYLLTGTAPEDLLEWTMLHPNLRRMDVREGWIAAGYDPAQAEPWVQIGMVSYENQARAWIDSGYTPSQAEPWVQAGLHTPAQVEQWSRLHPKFKDPQVVAKLIQIRAEPADAAELLGLLGL